MQSVSPGGAVAAIPLDIQKLPADVTYYQFLYDHYPIGDGESMEMELSGLGGWSSSSGASAIFNVQRRARDEWIGVPGHDVATTDEFFMILKQNIPSADHITFTLGDDPRKVKREQVEAGLEPEPIKFRSLPEHVVLLSSDDDDDASDAALFRDGAEGRCRFERRRFSMAFPEHLSQQAGAAVEAGAAEEAGAADVVGTPERRAAGSPEVSDGSSPSGSPPRENYVEMQKTSARPAPRPRPPAHATAPAPRPRPPSPRAHPRAAPVPTPLPGRAGLPKVRWTVQAA